MAVKGLIKNDDDCSDLVKVIQRFVTSLCAICNRSVVLLCWYVLDMQKGFLCFKHLLFHPDVPLPCLPISIKECEV